MVAGSSPEWLPPGFTQKVKYKNGRKIKYYDNDATGSRHYSKQDVLRCVTADNDLHGTPQTSEGGDKEPSSNKKDNVIFDTPNDSSQGLPDGWVIEEKTRKSGSLKGMSYKVYIESSTNNKFYSRAAVTRYLDSVDQSTAMISQNKLENVDKPIPDIPQCISETNTDHISKQKRKGGAFKMVTTKTTTDEDLPSGWIKEMRTSKSGSRIRKDPFYIDSASGYVFRSKKDALRYLETNDIRSCACRPLKRELDDLELKEIPSSNPAIEKLSNQKKELFPCEESYDGGEASGTKSLAGSSENLKQIPDSNVPDHVNVTSVGVDSYEENTSNKNSSKSAEIEDECVPANEDAKENPRIMNATDDPLSIKQQLSENQTEKHADRTQPGSRKSKKRGASSLPLRTSKRLARSEPEVLPVLDFSERSLIAAARKSSGNEVDMSPILNEPATISLPPDIEPSKEVVELLSVSKDTLEAAEPVKEAVEPPSVSKDTLEAVELEKEAAEPPSVSKDTLEATELEKEAVEPLSVSKDTLEATEPEKEAVEPPSVSKDSLEATEPEKEAAEPLSVRKETLAFEPEKEAGDPPSVRKETLEATEPLDKVEKPEYEELTIPDDPAGSKAKEKHLDGSKELQEPLFRFNFGDTWSDPLEFAVKTLRGDMSIEDTLKLTNCFSKPVGAPDNKVNGSLKPLQPDPPVSSFPFMQHNRVDGCLKPSQSDAPVNFHTEFLGHAGSFQQQSNSTVHSLPGNNLPPFSAPGNTNFLSFSGFNSQSSTQAGKNDFPTNSNRSSRT